MSPHIPFNDKSKRFSREDFPFDKGAQRLHLPGRQGFDDDRQAGQRWGDTLLPTRGARVPRLSLQTAVLSEGAGAQNPAQPL